MYNAWRQQHPSDYRVGTIQRVVARLLSLDLCLCLDKTALSPSLHERNDIENSRNCAAMVDHFSFRSRLELILVVILFTVNENITGQQRVLHRVIVDAVDSDNVGSRLVRHGQPADSEPIVCTPPPPMSAGGERKNAAVAGTSHAGRYRLPHHHCTPADSKLRGNSTPHFHPRPPPRMDW